jgi:hypothetical protein
MSTAAARRMRREHLISARLYRQRRKNGKACLRLEVDLGELADMLVDAGFLQQWDRGGCEKQVA